jgi:hypothetical protein
MPTHARPYAGVRPVVGIVISLALHALVFELAFTNMAGITDRRGQPAREQQVTVLILRPPESEQSVPEPELSVRAADAPRAPLPPLPVPEVPMVTEAVTPRQPASMAAPSAPTAEEWAFASTYKLKNSKGYRYTWGQQVRSMMGTAVEGPDQGMVRFRIEIAPDGSLTRLDTLWSTSAVAERLARQAIGSIAAMAAHADRTALDLREDHLLLAVRVGRPPALQGRLPARPAGVQQSVRLGWNLSPSAGPGQATRQAGPPGTRGLPQSTAAGFDRGRKRTRPTPDGPMGMGIQQSRPMSTGRGFARLN